MNENSADMPTFHDEPPSLLDAITLKRISYFPIAFEAVNLVKETLPEPVRLGTIAAKLGMAPTSLSRFFTTKVGTTFGDVVKRLRIEGASRELAAGDCSLDLLACRHGYSCNSAFTRAFKEIVGQTPSEFRRRLLHYS
jgi:two-component system, response regulator YesN